MIGAALVTACRVRQGGPMKIAPVVIAAVALTAGLASPAAAADKVPVKLKVKDCKGGSPATRWRASKPSQQMSS